MTKINFSSLHLAPAFVVVVEVIKLQCSVQFSMNIFERKIQREKIHNKLQCNHPWGPWDCVFWPWGLKFFWGKVMSRNYSATFLFTYPFKVLQNLHFFLWNRAEPHKMRREKVIYFCRSNSLSPFATFRKCRVEFKFFFVQRSKIINLKHFKDSYFKPRMTYEMSLFCVKQWNSVVIKGSLEVRKPSRIFVFLF